MQGDDLLRLLRRMGYTFPICVMTAGLQKALSLSALDDVEYFAKPFNIDVLLATVAPCVAPTP
jgi:DNA-binding response OmpR family regulator